MKILFAAYASGREFLRSLKRSKRDGVTTLSVHTRARYGEGVEVILEVGFPGLPNRVLLRCRAVPSRARFVGQRFDICEDQFHRVDFLAAVASGAAEVKWSRRHRRFPIEVPARFFVDEEGSYLRGEAMTEDVAAGGVALRTARSLPDGARVTIFLDFGGSHPEFEFQGQVVWTKGDSPRNRGVGIRFQQMNSEQMKQLRWLIRDVKMTGETGAGPAALAAARQVAAAAAMERGNLRQATDAGGGTEPTAPLDLNDIEPVTAVRPTPPPMRPLQAPDDEPDADTYRDD